MRKISISSQIIILFVLIMLVASSVFSSLVIIGVRRMAEREVYTRLYNYCSIAETFESDREPTDFRDITIYFIRHKEGTVIKTNNIETMINENDYNSIVSELNKNEEKIVFSKKIKNFEGRTIYFVIRGTNYGKTFTLVMANDNYVNNLVRNLSLQLIAIFLVIIFLAILVIIIWSRFFVKRIHSLRDHIKQLPKGGYDLTLVDDGLDEIGELSRAIEEMRIEIKQNEKIKQEMLQNISHDFKTPIAVIKSYAEAQQDGMADEESSKIIINQAEVLKNKVNRLLQYNSLEYLSKDREFEDVNMSNVVLDVIDNYRFQTNINIELDLTDDIYFKGYYENYCTVVDNIIDNARRYAKSQIKIILKKDRLRIYNDGEAIDEEFIKNGFKPYEKGNKGEFGLGMSIVQKIVDFFGMDLIVKNEDIGVSFIITKLQN